MITTHRSALIRLVLSSLMACTLLSAIPAQAREGSSSRSVGNGIKCSTVVSKDAQGRSIVTQVCRKGV